MAALLRREKTMMYAYSLSGPQAGQIAARARHLLQRRLLTPHQYALLDTVLWAARKPGSATLIASLKALARLAGQGRSTVAEGIGRLEELGLLQRIRRRVRVPWIGGGQASRQVANAYRLLPLDTESNRQPAREQTLRISVIESPVGTAKAAQAALAERRRTVEEALRYRPRYSIAV
jgi:hypothetical protein